MSYPVAAARGRSSAVAAGTPGQLVLQPAAAAGIDAFIYEGAPTTNYGTNTQLAIGKGGANAYRSLIKFDLTDLPTGATITSCVLSLWAEGKSGSGSENFVVHNVKRAWVEGQSTWNEYSTGNAWQTAGATGANDYDATPIGSCALAGTDATGEFKNFVLTPTTKAELDLGNGWLVKKASANETFEFYFSSSDTATAAQRPTLTIDYTT